MKILSDGSTSLRERFILIYTEAWKMLNDYRPKHLPVHPVDFDEDIIQYRRLTPSARTEAWELMLRKYSGYFKALDQTVCENESNLFFLKEMHDTFKSAGMDIQAEQVKIVLNEHDVESRIQY